MKREVFKLQVKYLCVFLKEKR